MQFEGSAEGIIAAPAPSTSTPDRRRGCSSAASPAASSIASSPCRTCSTPGSRRLRDPAVARATLRGAARARAAGRGREDRRPADGHAPGRVDHDRRARSASSRAAPTSSTTSWLRSRMRCLASKRGPAPGRDPERHGCGWPRADDRGADRARRRPGDADRQRARASGSRRRRSSTTGSADRAAAQRLLKALGCGALKQADTEIGVVDVTILAGADCFPVGDAPPAP